MKLPAPASLAVLLVSLLLAGAGCHPGLRYSDCDETPLTEPWIGMSIPVSDARVCKSSEGALTLQYLQGSVDELEPRHRRALSGNGYLRTECLKPASSPSRRTCRYLKGKQEMILTVVHIKWKRSDSETLSVDYSYRESHSTPRPYIWGERGEPVGPSAP